MIRMDPSYRLFTEDPESDRTDLSATSGAYVLSLLDTTSLLPYDVNIFIPESHEFYHHDYELKSMALQIIFVFNKFALLSESLLLAP